MVADEGKVKASMHHDSQSNECVGSGKGSETACFLGTQSDPRDFLTEGSSGIGSDKRLLRECGREGESSTEGVVGREGEWEVKEAHSEGGTLNCTVHHLVPRKMKKKTPTIDVCEERVRLDGVQERVPNGIASAYARLGKHHCHCTRSRWNW